MGADLQRTGQWASARIDLELTMALTQDALEDLVTKTFDGLFEELDSQRGDMPPSRLERMLDKANWGLGDDYRDWYELSGDPYE